MLNPIVNQKVVAALQQSTLFAGMDDDQFNVILSHSELLHKSPGQTLFQLGMPVSHFYFVYDGAIKLSKISINGNEKIIEVITAGRTFAEGVLFMGAPKYPVTSTALIPSVVVAIAAQPFLKLLNGSSELCLNMLGHLSVKLHWMVNELEKQSLHNASFRIIDYFLTQTEHVADGKYELHLQVPKRDIASRLSIKPETFSRVLRSLEEKSLIEVRENKIMLNDLRKLQSLVASEQI